MNSTGDISTRREIGFAHLAALGRMLPGRFAVHLRPGVAAACRGLHKRSVVWSTSAKGRKVWCEYECGRPSGKGPAADCEPGGVPGAHPKSFSQPYQTASDLAAISLGSVRRGEIKTCDGAHPSDGTSRRDGERLSVRAETPVAVPVDAEAAAVRTVGRRPNVARREVGIPRLGKGRSSKGNSENHCSKKPFHFVLHRLDQGSPVSRWR